MESHARRLPLERSDGHGAIVAPAQQPAISKHPQSAELTEKEPNFISLIITIKEGT